MKSEERQRLWLPFQALIVASCINMTQFLELLAGKRVASIALKKE